MDRGTIIEEGTYDELIAKDGFFAELVARQRLDDGGKPAPEGTERSRHGEDEAT